MSQEQLEDSGNPVPTYRAWLFRLPTLLAPTLEGAGKNTLPEGSRHPSLPLTCSPTYVFHQWLHALMVHRPAATGAHTSPLHSQTLLRGSG